MKTATLTAPQQTQAAANKAALATAQTAYLAAMQTHLAYLRTTAGVAANVRVQLSDDGTTVIIG
jgi:hypothetical protein